MVSCRLLFKRTEGEVKCLTLLNFIHFFLHFFVTYLFCACCFLLFALLASIRCVVVLSGISRVKYDVVMLQVCGTELIFPTGKGQGKLQQHQKQQNTHMRAVI